MPGGMFQGCKNVLSGTGVIHQDHERHCGATENVQRVVSLLQIWVYSTKDKQMGGIGFNLEILLIFVFK